MKLVATAESVGPFTVVLRLVEGDLHIDVTDKRALDLGVPLDVATIGLFAVQSNELLTDEQIDAFDLSPFRSAA